MSAVNDDAAFRFVDVHKHVQVGFWGRRKDLLRGVTFAVRRGAVYGFVGPNGAGKSTSIKLLIGAARPSTGTVEVLGRRPGTPDVARRVGYQPELPQLPPTLTPRELGRLHAALAGVPRGDVDRRVDALLDRVGLGARRGDRVGTFSKGMQQRMGLALALVADPELLVLDEPMSGLDPIGRRLVRDVVREEARAGKTVFFSSHVLTDVEALCDEAAFLHEGRLLASGPVDAALGRDVEGWEIRVRGGDGAPTVDVAGARVERHGDAHVVALPVGADAVGAAAGLVARGFVVESIEPLRPSLEDRLMALLGKEAAR